MVVDDSLKRVCVGDQKVPSVLRAAGRPVREADAPDRVEMRERVIGFGACDSLCRGGNPRAPFSQEVQGLDEVRECVDVARVDLPWPQVLVLEQQVRVAEFSSLVAQASRRIDPFGFRFQSGTVLQSALDCLRHAQRRLCAAHAWLGPSNGRYQPGDPELRSSYTQVGLPRTRCAIDG